MGRDQAKAEERYELTEKELDSLFRFVHAHRNSCYSVYFFNCTTFAVEATRAAGKSPPNSALFGPVRLPNALYSGILGNQRRGDKNAYTTPLEGASSLRPEPEQQDEPKTLLPSRSHTAAG